MPTTETAPESSPEGFEVSLLSISKAPDGVRVEMFAKNGYGRYLQSVLDK